MKKNTASFTAQMMALYRAMETSRKSEGREPDGRPNQGGANGPAGRGANGPAGERRPLFTDDYAHLFLTGRLRLAARIAAFPAGERWLYRYMQRRIPGALASAVARTRYIDDLLETWLRKRVRQVILLGAGFDTRALRLPAMRDAYVLEIDHPDTASRKQRILQKAMTHKPVNVRYLSIDFNQQTLGDLFREWGIFISQPTVILWEGVTNYLQPEAIDEVMRLAGRLPKGSAIIFTYIHKKVLEDPAGWYGAKRLIGDLARIGEKWTCGFLPEEMPVYLSQFGLRLMEDKGAAEYREHYMPERTVLLKGYEFYRVAIAEVV